MNNISRKIITFRWEFNTIACSFILWYIFFHPQLILMPFNLCSLSFCTYCIYTHSYGIFICWSVTGCIYSISFLYNNSIQWSRITIRMHVAGSNDNVNTIDLLMLQFIYYIYLLYGFCSSTWFPLCYCFHCYILLSW